MSLEADTKTQHEHPGKPEPVVVIHVWAPRFPTPKQFKFPEDAPVGVAAAQVAQDFGYAAGTPTFQNKQDEVLDRNKTLHDAGVRNGDKLELVDVGGGV